MTYSNTLYRIKAVESKRVENQSAPVVIIHSFNQETKTGKDRAGNTWTLRELEELTNRNVVFLRRGSGQ